MEGFPKSNSHLVFNLIMFGVSAAPVTTNLSFRDKPLLDLENMRDSQGVLS